MDKQDIFPIFFSHFSIGRAILTLDKPETIKENSPVSIFSIVKHYDLDKFVVVDNSLTGFIKLYQGSKDIKKQLIFGLKLVVVSDLNKKDEESLHNESKIIVFFNNSQAYYDAIKIYSLAATTGKYYVPRIDWVNLKKLWTPNLSLVIPFYDSFLHTNLLTMGSCVPEFPDKPVFCLEDHNLPFDGLLTEAINKYCDENKFEKIKTHSCFCYKNSDTKALQVLRAINQRSTFAKPELENFGVDTFSFEFYLNLIGEKL